MPVDIAPYECLPAFSRENFMKGPDWRYRQAVACLDDREEGKVPQVPSDPCVQYMVRAIHAYRNTDSRALMGQEWDSVYKVIHLGVEAPTSSITQETESLLIHGAEADDPEVKLLPFSSAVYNLYGKVFFDLSGIKAIHSWMHDYLFGGSTPSRNSFTAALRTRLLAYYGNRDVRKELAFSGRASGNALALMRTMASNERQKRLFDYVMSKMDLNDSDYAVLMEATLKDTASREFQEHMKDREDAGSSSLEDIANGLEAGIRSFSQTELQATSSAGLDFVNQFTKVILKDGTENSGS